MGKINGLNSELSGQVGSIVYRNTKKGTIVAQAPRKASTPRRSEKQMFLRCQLGNEAANFRLYDGKLALAFEDKSAGQSEFNLFVQTNYGVNPVFITKQERLNGACVVAPYQFTRGTLKSIGSDVNTSGILVSDIVLGGLVIGENTTVAQLAAAVIQNNSGWEDLDQITFFYATQFRDPLTNVPRATMDSYKVVLDLSDETLLMNKVSALGFSTVDGRLGMSLVLQNAGAAWVHSRDKGDGNIRVGSQRLWVVSEILAVYQTNDALLASADSYGGINTKSVYLNPSSSLLNYAPTGSSSGSSSGSGTGDSTSSGGGTNSNSSPTVTVAAPVMSDETTFVETTTVTITGPDGAEIHYTTDGSTPTAESTVYTEAITLSNTTTVKAIAIKDGISSEVTMKVFTKTDDNGDAN